MVAMVAMVAMAGAKVTVGHHDSDSEFQHFHHDGPEKIGRM